MHRHVPISPLTGYKYNTIITKKVSHPLYSDHFSLLAPAALPANISWLASMPPVWDQGQEGACTAFAAKEVREWLSIHYVLKGKPLVPLSAQFQYYCERLLNGDVTQDNGSSVSTAMMAMKLWGICPENDEPYATALTTKPSAKDFADAAHYKIGNIYALNTLTAMKNALAAGWVFELGFLVYESFESTNTTNTGIMTMPKRGEQLLGGHAISVWGYNDAFTFPGLPNGALCCRNSWDSIWGNNGNFFMPYSYVNAVDPQYGAYVSDSHLCHLGPIWS